MSTLGIKGSQVRTEYPRILSIQDSGALGSGIQGSQVHTRYPRILSIQNSGTLGSLHGRSGIPGTYSVS